MIVVRMTGGLGNQMFQYAAGRRLALKHGVELRLDVGFYRDQQRLGGRSDRRRFELDRFRLTAARVVVPYATLRRLPRRGTKPAPGGPKMVYVQQRRAGYGVGYTPWFEEIPAHAYVDGFWQSEAFFAPIADVIRADFAPADPADAPSEAWLSEAREAVAVHVRRGDYLRYPEFFHLVSARYLAEAMDLFGEDYWFPVFSDDPEWCRANLRGRNLRIMPMDDAVRDLYRMAACAHVITANSSFSWWAGWLNRNPQKRVVAPWPWSSRALSRSTREGVIPPDWTVLPI